MRDLQLPYDDVLRSPSDRHGFMPSSMITIHMVISINLMNDRYGLMRFHDHDPYGHFFEPDGYGLMAMPF